MILPVKDYVQNTALESLFIPLIQYTNYGSHYLHNHSPRRITMLITIIQYNYLPHHVDQVLIQVIVLHRLLLTL